MTLSMKSWAVIVGVALLVLAVILVLLVVPSLSGAGALEWFTHPNASPCACVGDPGL